MDTATRPSRPAPLSFDEVVDLVREHADVRVRPAAVGAFGSRVTGITLDSRRVVPGDVYAALPGARAHGIEFVEQAAAGGAVAVLTDETGATAVPADLPAIVVDVPRAVLGEVSAGIYGHPARSMRMIGVTGTQGKTTVTRLLDSGLGAAGVVSAVIGTVGTRVAGSDLRTSLTTPEAPDLHGLFAVMRERGVECCAMEVSSHALVLGRVDGVVFDVAVFTNLGRDHLDFHADVEDYFAAKTRLFGPDRARLALVNVDDEHGRRLADTAAIPVRTMSTTDGAADWTAGDVDLGPEGSTFVVRGPGGRSLRASVALPGDFNVANALSAIAAAVEAGFDVDAVVGGLAAAGGVPGRLERVTDDSSSFAVYVDYAHKPDALDAVLRTLRPLTRGELVVVLGAGGDRDRGKRPLMGAVAADLADVVLVTDDNPRSEDPAAIRAEIMAGAAGRSAEVEEHDDRRDAIAAALARARSGDVVLIAGKGHETGQEVAGVVHPFDDRDVARELLEAGR